MPKKTYKDFICFIYRIWEVHFSELVKGICHLSAARTQIGRKNSSILVSEKLNFVREKSGNFFSAWGWPPWNSYLTTLKRFLDQYLCYTCVDFSKLFTNKAEVNMAIRSLLAYTVPYIVGAYQGYRKPIFCQSRPIFSL